MFNYSSRTAKQRNTRGSVNKKIKLWKNPETIMKIRYQRISGRILKPPWTIDYIKRKAVTA